MKKNYYRLILLITGLHFLAFGVFGQNILYTVTSDTGSVLQPVDSTIAKSINVKFNNSFLVDQATNLTLTIVLPEPGMDTGRRVTIVKTRQVVNPNLNSFSWYGKLENEPGSFVLLTQVNTAVSGYIRTQNNRLYRINYIGNNLHRISKVNQKFFKPDRSDIPIATLSNYDSSGNANSQQLCYDTSGVIDVLVCYTVLAKERAGGHDAMMADIVAAVEISNQSYFNSLINQKIELVRAVEVAYTESGNGKTDRDRLQLRSDNFLDNVHNIRQTESADIVVLLIENGGPWSAVAYTMETPSPAFEAWAFCVLERSAAIANFSFTHELGHIMGAEHDCEFDAPPISYPYSHGHRHGEFKTIMSKHALGTRVEYWANTSVPFPGTTFPSGGRTGECLANDFQTLLNTVDIVSKFRCKNSGPRGGSWCSWWSPWCWIGLILSILIIAMIIWFFWRRRRRNR